MNDSTDGSLNISNTSGVFTYISTLFHYQKHYPMLLMGVIVSIVLWVVYQGTQPIIFEWLFNDVIYKKNTSLLILAIGVIALNFFLIFVSQTMTIVIGSKLNVKVFSKIKYKLFSLVQNLNHSDGIDPSDVMTHFGEHLVSVESTSLFIIWYVLGNILTVFLSAVLMFYFNWVMALISLFSMIGLMFLPHFLAKKTTSLAISKEGIEKKLRHDIHESVMMHDEIRLNLLKKYKRNLFKISLIQARQATYRHNMSSGFTGGSFVIGAQFILMTVMIVGSVLIFYGNLNSGGFVGFVVLLQNFVTAVNGLSTRIPLLMQSARSLSSIEDLLKRKQTKSRSTQALSGLKNKICFDQVIFGYGHRRQFNEINLTIHAGKMVGIVGPNGSGKSTFLKLLLKEITPHSGQILFDGINYKHVSEQSLLSNIGVVMQEPKLFECSIQDNIRMGKLDATDEEVIAVAKKVGIHDDIMLFPQQYKTIFGHKSGLSGGQCQRVCIARALISNPAIVCLDEATSALDSLSAAMIEETLENMRGQHTLIVITHRLQSIMNADLIVVMNNGAIQEMGTHQALLDKQGLYLHLWEKQRNSHVHYAF